MCIDVLFVYLKASTVTIWFRILSANTGLSWSMVPYWAFDLEKTGYLIMGSPWILQGNIT